MQDLVKQEQFEMEVLDRLNTCRILPRLIFGGGTMLRLCYGLNRFSIDLDFWLAPGEDPASIHEALGNCLDRYTITDRQNKHYTILYEIRSDRYPRALKIKVRKEHPAATVEQAIAFSRHSRTQVRVPVMSLQDMANTKLRALISRREIRDAFDLEFLLRKGAVVEPGKERDRAGAVILAFNKNDYRVKLGSLLEAQDRQYYAAENFKQLLIMLAG
jgi:predicted nucleotidyltransferase component of viral defense system